MDKKYVNVFAFLIAVVVSWVLYRGLQFFMLEKPRDERMHELVGSLNIKNDVSDIFAEFLGADAQSKRETFQVGSAILKTRGKVRIFVPEKKGWYTIKYPYPYPLTKLASLATDLRFVDINLSSLINSVDSGEVVYVIREGSGVETGVAKDIKVTFEPGEGPKKEFVDNNIA